jgi:hypothetical protein
MRGDIDPKTGDEGNGEGPNYEPARIVELGSLAGLTEFSVSVQVP